MSTSEQFRSSIEDTTKTVIVDDVTEIRYLTRLLLANVRGVQIVGEGSNGKDAIELARRLQPQLMLLDLEMPVMSGLDALPTIVEASPATKVIVWTGKPDKDSELIELGAHSVIRKGGDPQVVVDEVRFALMPLGTRW